MTGIGLGTGFSLFIVMMATTVLFVWTWLRSHGVTQITYVHVDSMAGDEGEE